MSNYVFKDSERKIKLYSKDCNLSHKDIMYYCPTPNCMARLTLRSLDGDRNPYFSALQSKPHCDFCTIHKIRGAKTDYDVSDFSIETLFNSIISKPREVSSSTENKSYTPGAQSGSEKINSTRLLYYFCKGHDINHTVKDKIKVIDLIADSRTNFFFTKGIYGLKLAETKFYRYVEATNTIELNYPIDPLLKNQHKLTITFENHSDFTKITKKIFNNKKHYSMIHIAVLGEWINNKCTIKHWKQIFVI